MHVPTDVDTNLHGEAGSQQCFIPKACVHTWTGHTKGVNAIRLFPGSGHLMLSASNDCKIKVIGRFFRRVKGREADVCFKLSALGCLSRRQMPTNVYGPL